MKSFLLLLSFFTVLGAGAQEQMALPKGGGEASWKVQWGKKTVLKANAEDETANVVTLKRADLGKKNTFTLTYTGAANQRSGWNRSITIYNGQDSELKTVKGSILTLSAGALKALAAGQGELKIYTIAVPADPKRAAVVRVRRVHLVTIRVV